MEIPTMTDRSFPAPTRRSVLSTLAALTLPTLSALAVGQDTYPAKPIRLVVSFPAGGSADAQARLLATKLTAVLGKPVIVDNKSGAGGNIGAEAVAKAAPDGYTILLAAASMLCINPWIYPKLPFDPAKDFAFIGQVAAFQGVVVVTPSQPFHTMKELVAFAKAHPGQLAYGSPGSGTTPHLASELFKRTAGLDLQHVPYRGDSAALVDTTGGQIPVSFVNLGPAVPLVQSGRLRALAVTGIGRSAALPEVPTLEEAGFPHSAVPGWSGLVAPAGTPTAAITKLSDALKTVTNDAEFKDKFAQQSAEAHFSAGPAFGAMVAAERVRLGKLIKEAGIRFE
jgi:tripartite-type tricarboxylate transporter receptor subunit TctC